MFQVISDRIVFVVDLPVFPPPLPIHSLDDPKLKHYAEALQFAIANGLVDKPGKYAIQMYDGLSTSNWKIFRIEE